MKMKSQLALYLLLAAFSIPASQAKSTNDFQKWELRSGETLDATLFGVYNGLAYVRDKKQKTFQIPIQAITENAHSRITDWFTNFVDTRIRKSNTVAESESPLTKFLSKNLVTWKDGEFVSYDFGNAKEPDFYAFYFSAQWCGPCREFTPSLRAFYNAMKAAGHDNFEIIFVSWDRGKKSMSEYMEEDKMPWPAVQYNKREHSFLNKYEGSGIPCLVLTDKDGNLISHTYRAGEYMGPSTVKTELMKLLSFTKGLREKYAE